MGQRIRVETNAAYYHDKDTEAFWYPRHRIVEVDLGLSSRLLRYHAAILARNVEQIVLGLTPDKEVLSVEVIGATFRVDDDLEMPEPSCKGNLRIAPEGWEEVRDKEAEHQALTFDYGDQNLVFTTNERRDVFRIALGGDAPGRYICPGAHLVYGITDEKVLSEMWIVIPTRSKMK